MRLSQVLRDMDIGSSVAEFDQHLEKYFCETQIYNEFINDKFDILSGDKGTGKTAIYKFVRDRYRAIPELSQVELISGFNDSGNPIFQRLSQVPPLSEGQYNTVWKTYFFSLIGNHLLDVYEGYSDSMKKLDRVLLSLDLRTKDPTATTVFSQISNLLRRLLEPKSVEMKMTVSEAGIPILTPKLEFGDIATQEIDGQKVVLNDDALALLSNAIDETGIKLWVILDRLDEAFAGTPAIEIPILRALLRTYLDLSSVTQLRLKLFVRNDLFRKIIRGGFVNLTHINARRVQLQWSPDDLYGLLMRRLRECKKIHPYYGVSDGTADSQLFSFLLPEQVDAGEKRPTTWNWIVSRITDSNEVIPPRNLIDIINKSKEAQARKEERVPRDFDANLPLIESDAIRKGLDALSSQRVEDTLLAESGDSAPFIEKFRNGKAEHNLATIAKTLQVAPDKLPPVIDELKALGFLEEVGSTYKIPMLYRSGLNITQGKAFGEI